MSGQSSTTTEGRLPATLPLFPLPGALLLPHGHLPLQIFEPRYLKMVEYALGDARTIGMIQPLGDDRDPVPDNAEVYQVGCAGRIVEFSETDDDRFLITLRGICRFRIAEEMPLTEGFRRVVPDFGPFHLDLEEEDGKDMVDRAEMLDAANEYLRAKDLVVDWSAVETIPDDELVSALSMICPFEPREKQALLECRGCHDRGLMLMSLFEMASHGGETHFRGTSH
jgi:Lon protease-like protein